MDYEKKTKTELIKQLKKADPYFWIAQGLEIKTDELFSVLVVLREFKGLEDQYHAKQVINACLTLVVGIQADLDRAGNR